MSSSMPFQPSDIRLGIARGVSYGLFGPPDEFVAASRELGAGLDPGLRVLESGATRAGPLGLDHRRRAPGPAHRRGGGVGDRVLELALGDARADGLPALVAGHGRGSLRRLRTCAGVAVRGPGPLLAVQQRAQQRRPALDGERGGLRGPASGLSRRRARVRFACRRRARRLRIRRSVRSCAGRRRGSSSTTCWPPGSEWFDLFAVHLYDDPARIPGHVDTVREMMRAHGYERPVMVGEYNGPTLFQLPEVEPVLAGDDGQRVRRRRCGRRG